MPGTQDSSAVEAIGANEGLIPTAPLVVAIVLNVLMGLRDKVTWIAARSEQYVPALIFFAFFPFVDMVVAAKILIVTVWVGAAVSKIGRHFGHVIPPMVSNTPWMPSKTIKRMHYRDYPDDIRPSERALMLAHGPGTVVELITPLVLLFSQNHTLTVAAVVVMMGFHLFIISTFPLAVPLEWNALFMYLAAFLFLQFPAWDGYGVGDMDPALLALTVVGCTLFPIIGNNRPDWVSFLPSMRQYAGNWASALWAFAPGAERKLDEHLVKPANTQKQQLTDMFGEDAAELVLQHGVSWRAMHSMGRGLNSVMMNLLDEDIDSYYLRDAEALCNVRRRLQLRRRAPARLAADRGDPEALQLRAGRVHRGVGRVGADLPQQAAVLGHGRGRRLRRARRVEGDRRGRGAAVAAERADTRST